MKLCRLLILFFILSFSELMAPQYSFCQRRVSKAFQLQSGPAPCTSPFVKEYNNEDTTIFPNRLAITDDGLIISASSGTNGGQGGSAVLAKTNFEGDVLATTGFTDRTTRIHTILRTGTNQYLTLIASERWGTNNNGNNLTLYQHDAQLKENWQKTYDLPFFTYTFRNLITDDRGNIFICLVYTTGSSDPNYIGVLKFNSTGDFLWMKRYTDGFVNTFEQEASIAFVDGALYLTGGYFATGRHTYLSCLNPGNGEPVWAKEFSHNNDVISLATSLSVMNHQLLLEGRMAYRRSLLLADKKGTIVQSKMYINNSDNSDFETRIHIDADTSITVSAPWYGKDTSYRLLYRVNSQLQVTSSLSFVNNLGTTYLERDPVGNLYELGFIYWSDWHKSTFALKKYLPDFSLGECSGQPFPITTEDVPITTTDIQLPYGDFTGVTSMPILLQQKTTFLVVASVTCSAASCTELSLTGKEKICSVTEPYAFALHKSSGCHQTPQLVYDPSRLTILGITDDSIRVLFLQPGTASLQANLSTGCGLLSDEITTFVSPSPRSLKLGRDTLLCGNNSVQLTAGTGFSSYQWQDGSEAPDYLAAKAGTYHVTVSNACGETLSDTIQISADALPPIDLGQDRSKCNNDTVWLQTGSGFKQYLWLPADHLSLRSDSSSAMVYPAEATRYSVSAVKGNGCPTADSVLITIQSSPPVRLPDDTVVCAGASPVLLDAGTGFTKYQWSSGETTQSLTATTGGVYSVAATYANGCVSKDTFRLQVDALPAVYLGADTSICAQTSYLLQPGVFTAYRWADESTSPAYQVQSSGTLWVEVTDMNGCRNSDTLVVTGVRPLPRAFMPDTASFCYGDVLTLKPTQTFAAYEWSTGSRSSSLPVRREGTYQLKVTDEFSCTGEDTIQVSYKACQEGIFFPGAFTPDGNGNNDVYRAAVHGYPQMYRLQIFNRFGERVFQTTDAHGGWDGTLNNIQQASGVFVAQAVYQFHGQEVAIYTGTVLLLR